MTPPTASARILQFLKQSNVLDDQEALRELDRHFPEGEPLRERAKRAWEKAKIVRVSAKDDDIAVGESLDIEGFDVGRRIGEGGGGFVHLANQLNPRRQVAVKYLKTKLGRNAAARLEREVSLISRIKHPDVVTIFSAGETDCGRPYLVMEYVEGKPVGAFCQDKALDLASRLHLMIRICNAVDYVHRRETIHRDLKPSNILVTAETHPKVIDFGIAKMLYSDPDDELVASFFKRVPYSPEYSSPEQEKGEPVETSTDVFSLGRILYGLLTGSLCGKERPQPPSEAEDFGFAPREIGMSSESHWRASLRGDLDAIVMKAVDPNPGLRYETARELGEELQRHLNLQPVRARPQSRSYSASLFVRRNPASVVLCGFLLTGLIAALIYSGWQRQRAEQAARVASENERLARDSEGKATEQARLYQAAAGGFREGVERISSKLARDISRQRQAMKGMYAELARKYPVEDEYKGLLVGRALNAMDDRNDPDREEMEGLEKRLAPKLGHPIRGGGNLPKGATPLALLDTQLSLALLRLDSASTLSDVAGIRNSVRQAAHAFELDADGVMELRTTVCGVRESQRRLRELIPEIGGLCK